MVWDSPASAEPIRKMTIEASKNVLRPYRSPSLPHSGVDTVDASRYAVTTQDRCDSPCRSPAMVGSAVATIVWSSAASSIPSSSAPMMMSVRRWVISLGSWWSTAPPPASFQHHRPSRARLASRARWRRAGDRLVSVPPPRLARGTPAGPWPPGILGLDRLAGWLRDCYSACHPGITGGARGMGDVLATQPGLGGH